MPSAVALRSQIESVLARRIPSALTPATRVQRALAETGIPAMDALLGGGLPVGAISELIGPMSSGRTSAALQFLARRTQEGQVCAWVDVQDAFDPESAAANGIGLERLLWVRCGQPAPALVVRQPDAAPQPSQPARAVNSIQHGCGGMHPRGEARGMDLAVAELMQRRANHIRDKTVGTPGVVNRPLGRVPRHEQVSSDRAPKRRGQQVVQQLPGHNDALCPRCAETSHKPRPDKPYAAPAPIAKAPTRSFSGHVLPIWTLLDQAVRAIDQLLQAGGFSTIVFDMGDTPMEQSTRVPLATWFRYRQAADQARTSLLVLAQHPCAGSSAEVVLRFDPLQVQDAGGRMMQAARFRATVAKQRFAQPIEFGSPRKPAASTWSAAIRAETGIAG